MARVLICDACKCQDGVKPGLADLCHDCAMKLLDKLVSKECLAEQLIDWKPNPATVSAASAAPAQELVMTDEARTRARWNALQIQHGTKAIYLVSPNVPINKYPAKITYNDEVVEVLEAAPPNPHGTHFAKRMGS